MSAYDGIHTLADSFRTHVQLQAEERDAVSYTDTGAKRIIDNQRDRIERLEKTNQTYFDAMKRLEDKIELLEAENRGHRASINTLGRLLQNAQKAGVSPEALLEVKP